MTKEEKQRGLELQGYIDSIRDMTIKEIAIKHLKKYHLPKFLTGLLVKFSTPLLLAKDYELVELEAQVEKMKCCANCKYSRTEYEHCRTDKHEKWEIKENDKKAKRVF